MKIVTLLESLPLTFNKSASSRQLVIDAMRPYLFSDTHFNKISGHLMPRAYRISRYETRLKPFIARKVNGEKVIFYNGAGGYGDQLMSWPVAKILYDLGYKVHILTDPGNELCWSNFPWIDAIYQTPIEKSHMEMFDNIAFFEVVTNNDEHEDQLHPVDNLLMRMGLNPNAIEPHRKVVKPMVTPNELQQATKMVGGRSIALYQLATTSQLRSLTPERSADLLAALARAFPQFHWLALHDKFNEPPYVEAATSAIASLNNVQLAQFADFRLLFSVASMASLAVSPDSFLVHLAGTCGLPTVGLWGVTRSDLRTKYYENHLAVWPNQACPMAPCLRTVKEFPNYCPPSAEPRKMCAVMGAISPDDVISAVKSLNVS